MRILTRRKQNDVYQALVEITKTLSRVYVVDRSINLEIRDAITSAFEIANIVGGQEMLEAMKGPLK